MAAEGRSGAGGLACTAGLAADAQLEAAARVRELEEGLRLERNRNVWSSTPLLASGLADKVGEQGGKLQENLGQPSANWEGPSHCDSGLRACDQA